MAKDSGRDEIELSNGRKISANCGILGIDNEGNLYEGYDGVLFDSRHDNAQWTAEERRELAQFAIERWQKWGGIVEPEWRPLSVVTVDVIKRWRTWAFIKPKDCCPTVTDLAPSLQFWMDKNYIGQGMVCRPVDREGIPVPWSQVGL